MTELVEAVYRRQNDFWEKSELQEKFWAKNRPEKEKKLEKFIDDKSR